ncbi:ketopantoate reductase family protein [Sporolactobacillus shoreicorticis]|uniref:2-dehydropantoate 2-reductase n=1 Tax=Sporolactobacillus shoreicorticis TaxID=1923877 RepID=A0ABW5S1M5_9BACL|nr:ketopantoate reductase family protein [Sporolactobacillus shoreicorticis]MCO7127228.1 ketopantoate reductase family protein [Sporolactobacillus shoreicorticis]
MKIKTVAIVGLGALGIMYGKQLSDHLGKDAVRIVADHDRIERYKKEGIYCNGELCDFHYVDANEQSDPADLLIFAVKYTGLKGAIESAGNQIGKQTILLSVLNGISSEQMIGEAFGFDQLLYCIVAGMDASKIGNKLTYENIGFVSFGEPDDTRSEKVDALARLFEKTEIPYEIPDRIRHKMWSKLMVNTGVNQSTAVFETNYGGIQVSGKPRETVIAAMKEVVKVANAEGVPLQESEIAHWLKINDDLNPEGMPSMRQDTLQNRPTEVDLFAGTIRKLGKKHGIPTPVNDFLYKRIRAIEASYAN